jgi:hypothetical protein
MKNYVISGNWNDGSKFFNRMDNLFELTEELERMESFNNFDMNSIIITTENADSGNVITYLPSATK